MVHTQIYNIVEQDYPTFSFPFSITLHSKMHIKYHIGCFYPASNIKNREQTDIKSVVSKRSLYYS